MKILNFSVEGEDIWFRQSNLQSRFFEPREAWSENSALTLPWHQQP